MGRVASENAPAASVTGLNELSKTSIRLLWKSAAYSRLPLPPALSASPLYTAPVATELSITRIAWVASTLGAHPAMTPSSVAKMNRLGPETPLLETTKPVDALNTMPVGAPFPLALAGGGIFTMRD